jgi:mannose-1-phosphate guanylyltransferase/mannose-6-phosphate isomerase
LSTLIPVILAGGSGTRLWPLSRAAYPKQFFRFAGTQTSSLLGDALTRLQTCASPIIVCNSEHRFLVRSEAQNVGVVPYAVILEPVARNTAPAVTTAALLARRIDPDATIVVMASDHLMGDPAAFAAAVLQAGDLARSGKFVLFGIAPDEPHTGYGYIEVGETVGGGSPARYVRRFTEKPDLQTAQKFLSQGNYLWNSGMFVLPVAAFLEEVQRLVPEILSSAERALAGAKEDLGFLRLDTEAFALAPAVSIDHAIMEKTDKAVVLPFNGSWSDVGSWSSVWAHAAKDSNGNAMEGPVVLEETRGCYVHAGHRLIATLGVQNLVIVETPDALLVADRGHTQAVGGVVKRLKGSGRREVAQHIRSHRPWGYFETLNVGPRFQVKRLHVAPGARLSLQMHHHRSEHWIVVRGTAKVTIGEREQLVRENESVYITATEWHRLENPGKVPVEIIEVQLGTYLGEDDIVRSDDDYLRAPDETR